MHEWVKDRPQVSTETLVAVLVAHTSDKDWKAALDELRDVAGQCPACILTAINLSGLQKVKLNDEGINTAAQFGFEFKKERDELWEQINEDARQYC